MANEIKAFKMVTGEELVAEVVSRALQGGAITVRRPHIIQLQQASPGQYGLVFIPWALSNPDIDKAEIQLSSIVVEFEPGERIQREYLSQTSGIKLAGA